MYGKNKFIWLILALAVLFAATAVSAAGESADNGDLYRLPVFETSDIHGYIVDTSTEKYEYRLAYIADKVNDARGGDAGKTILLDGGDNYQGNTLSNLLEGNPISAAFAFMGYDAVTIGNHEFDWGITTVIDGDATMQDYTFDGVPAENRVPVVLSNLYLNGEKVTFARDYVILEKKAVNAAGDEIGVRVAVIGFADNYGTSIMPARFLDAGYSISEDYAAVDSLAKELESSGACDATILLMHADAATVAAQLDSSTVIDLVAGGHSHENECGETEWGLVYIEPANYGMAYTYSELTFRAGADGKPVFESVENACTVSVIENSSLLLATEENAAELDASVVAAADEAIRQISDILNEKVGTITVSAMKPTERVTESGEPCRVSTAGNWMCSIYARAVGAEIAFVNAGGIRESFAVPEWIGSRDITVSDVHAMFPFNNRIYCYEITYEELLTLLDYSLTYAGGTLFSVMTGIDVYYTGHTVNALVKDGETIYADGAWSGDYRNAKVKIAASDYLSTTQRQSDKETGALTNPLCDWMETDRLLENEQIDSEAALRILREEAAENGGLLTFDEKTHYIKGEIGTQDSGSSAEPGSIYTVTAGDTLWLIARRFYGTGLEYEKIAKANNLSNPNLIYAGTELILLAK